VQLKVALTGCCLEQSVPTCCSIFLSGTRRRSGAGPRPVVLVAALAVSIHCERSGSALRRDSSLTCGRYDRAPSCTWDVAAARVARPFRARTGIARRSDTDHVLRTLDTAPSCSAASPPSSPSPTTARPSPSPSGRSRPSRPQVPPSRAPPTAGTRSQNE